MWESVIVGIIVGVAAVAVVRRFWRGAKGKTGTCACGGESCPAEQTGKAPQCAAHNRQH